MDHILDEWRKDSRCTSKVTTKFIMEQAVRNEVKTSWLTWEELKRKYGESAAENEDRG